MKNSDTSDIDKLFREGLAPENDPATYTPSGWPEMAQRLDRHAKWKGVVFRLKKHGWVAALLLLFFSIWAILPEKKEQPVLQTEVRQKDQGKQEIQKESPETEAIRPEAGPEPGASLPVSAAVRKTPFPEDLLPETKTADPDRAAMADLKTRDVGILPVPEHPETSHPDPVETSERVVPATIFNAVPPELLLKTPSRKWPVALSILAAPSYNGVNSLNDAKTGSDFGLMLTIGLTKKWSFSTGVVYAKKLYAMGYTSDYTPPSGNGSGYNDPQSVDADCRVLDIPLNLNYALIDKGKTAVTVGTGVSSYFMLKENYRFLYAGQYDDPQDLELTNENQHWLSVLNFQASYERKLNSKVSISLQPYLKIPFRDIGYAKVRLQSVGMALGATWNL